MNITSSWLIICGYTCLFIRNHLSNSYSHDDDESDKSLSIKRCYNGGGESDKSLAIKRCYNGGGESDKSLAIKHCYNGGDESDKSLATKAQFVFPDSEVLPKRSCYGRKKHQIKCANGPPPEKVSWLRSPLHKLSTPKLQLSREFMFPKQLSFFSSLVTRQRLSGFQPRLCTVPIEIPSHTLVDTFIV